MRSRLSLKFVCLYLVLLVFGFAGCSQKHYAQVHDHSIALYYQDKDAKEVLFACSIDQFQLHQANKEAGGVWEVIVPREGDFSYFYLVDKNLTIPDCEYKIQDDFGAQNCVFVSGM